MKWSELCIHTTEEAIEPITNILYEAGAAGVAIEDSRDLVRSAGASAETYQLNPDDYPLDGVNIKVYLPITSFLGETVAEIKQAVSNLRNYSFNIGENRWTISERNEEEWATAWKKYYKPVAVGDQFQIVPSWSDYQSKDQTRQTIELDPGMAFGTGTHPTTVLCLEALEQYMIAGDKVLDVGTGTGVLSIAAAKLGAHCVLGVDLDPVAVHSAQLNVKLNKVQERVTVRQNDLIHSLKPGYDLIVGNLLAELVLRLAKEGIASLLAPGGRLIVSGIICDKKERVIEALQEVGLSVIACTEKGDWVCLVIGGND
ncbi:MAG: 50S ribosomal protein L11 methyltransferase [Sporolactobacillus sp.]